MSLYRRAMRVLSNIATGHVFGDIYLMDDQQPHKGTKMHIPDDHWQPLSVEETVSLFAPASFQWGIAGGYAIELFAGHVYRAHGDTDVIIFRDEQLQAQQHLNDWALFAADPPGTLRPWHADEFLARGIHDIWGHQHGVDAWQFQFMVMEIDGDAWFSRHNEQIRGPKNTLFINVDGIPVIRPEVQLLFKSRSARPKDELDFAVCLPLLDDTAKAWLREAINTLHPNGHHWLKQLT